MKRELKFRAWEDYGEGHRMMLHDRGDLAEFFDATVGDPIMQYTGLKDKNGKEIYEGDILKNGYGTGTIIWDQFAWKIEWIKTVLDDDKSWLPCKGFKHLEIIGNIYENPELL